MALNEIDEILDIVAILLFVSTRDRQILEANCQTMIDSVELQRIVLGGLADTNPRIEELLTEMQVRSEMALVNVLEIAKAIVNLAHSKDVRQMRKSHGNRKGLTSRTI